MDMANKKLICLSNLFSIMMSLDPYDEYMDFGEILDKGIEYNPEAEDVKFLINIEMIRLLNEGYSEDEVLEMIDGMDIEGFKELSDKYQNYVKEESKKLLLKRKEKLNYE